MPFKSNITDIKTSKISILRYIIAIILFLLSLITILVGLYGGLVLFIIGLLVILYKEGIKVDAENKKIMMHVGLAKLVIKDKWIDVANSQYISVVRVRLTQRSYSHVTSRLSSSVQCKVNIILPNKRYISLYRNKNDKAIKLAKSIANILNLRILDLSHGEKNWIEPENIN